jgi:hypothetical protein
MKRSNAGTAHLRGQPIAVQSRENEEPQAQA